jgi:hypothetical protein
MMPSAISFNSGRRVPILEQLVISNFARDAVFDYENVNRIIEHARLLAP